MQTEENPVAPNARQVSAQSVIQCMHKAIKKSPLDEEERELAYAGLRDYIALKNANLPAPVEDEANLTMGLSDGA